MGKGEGTVAMEPNPIDLETEQLKRKKEKKLKKEKKEKKEKKDKKEKKEKRNSLNNGESKKRPAEQPIPNEDELSAKKAKVNDFYNANFSGSNADNDMEDTNIGLGKVAKDEIKSNDINSFGLSATTLKLLTDRGITSLFDIQAATFNHLRHDNKDIIGRAKTGSGKTLAFVLPVVEAISATSMHRASSYEKPLVLCLAPTRELAQQVHRDFEWIAGGHGMSTACFTGGSMKGPQRGAIQRGLDVLVGTPGRIIDHLDEGNLTLAHVRYIVLDEADEMLSMGFQDAVERILGECTTSEMKQTLLFSATVPRWVKDLARKYMRTDATVTVDTVSDTENRTNTDITHLAIGCPWSERGDTIADVVKVYTGSLGKTIIFTDTKVEANEVSGHEKLVNALGGVGVLHGDIPQGQREATLGAYREGKIRVLVATDVAARGLDIKAVDLVIQTHPPSNYEAYIHRSGRTARAGQTGTCVTFYSQKEKYLIGLIEHKAGMKFKRANPPQAADIVKASVSDTVKTISSVHKDNLSLFREVARQVIEKYDDTENGAETALAASLACLAGYTSERYKTRSLLSCFQGYTAMMIAASRPFEAPGQVWGILKRFVGPESAGEIKGSQVCKDKNTAVFDVPDRLVDTVLQASEGLPDGMKISMLTEMPQLKDDEFNLQSAMSQLNERRSVYRSRRDGGGFRNNFGNNRGGGGGSWRGSRGFGGGRGRGWR